MAPALPWACMVCVALASTLARASVYTGMGVSIHPVFSTSLYVAKDPQPSVEQREKEQALGHSQETTCEIFKTTESGPDLHAVKTLTRRTFSFLVKPESSFKRLMVKLSLQNSLYDSGDFYSDEDFTLTSKDVILSEDSQWTHVTVQHRQYKRRGFDRHSFTVSFANKTVSRVTHESWLWNDFKGFTVFADGGANVLFNCLPDDLHKTAAVADYVPDSMWVMAGLLVVAVALLAVLCLVWVYLKYQRKKQKAAVLPKTYPIYDEFDEEVLEGIKQKVEALRRGESKPRLDTVVVKCPPRQENVYVLDTAGYGGVEGESLEKHIYEDIDKYYNYQNVTGNVYESLPGGGGDGNRVSITDNIYESLPCFENYSDQRRGEARVSFPVA